MRFEFTLGPSPSTRPPRLRGPVRRVLVLADLLGNGAAPRGPLLERLLVKVDLDNLDDVLARCAPSIQLQAVAGGERLEVRSFDDLHPDRLVETLALFQRTRDLRTRLGHPSTFAAAVSELQADTPDLAGSEPSASGEVGAASTLERLLGRTPSSVTAASESAAAPRTTVSVVDALIRQAVAPHIVPAPSPQLPQLVSAVDSALTDLMRAVLHDPAFQAVESTWRALQWLVSTLELDETLELLVFDVTRDELAGAARDGALWQRLVERTGGPDDPLQLSALVGNFRFGTSADDLAMLESLGMMASALGSPFLAEATPDVLGISSFVAQPYPREWAPLEPEVAARWTAFRARPAASHVGLACPRFLLRLPYGQKSDPISAFRFEEQPATPDHERFLWANPAWACAVVAVRLLADDADPDGALTLDALPVFTYTADDERCLQPVAELAPTEPLVVAIQAHGLMPLICYRDRDVARLAALHSVASPSSDLLG